MKTSRYILSLLALIVAGTLSAQVAEFHLNYGDDSKFESKSYLSRIDSILYVPAQNYSAYIYVESFYTDDNQQVHVIVKAETGPNASYARVAFGQDLRYDELAKGAIPFTNVPSGTTTTLDFVVPDPTQVYMVMLYCHNNIYHDYYYYYNYVDYPSFQMKNNPLQGSTTGTYSYFHFIESTDPGLPVSYTSTSDNTGIFTVEHWGYDVSLNMYAEWDYDRNIFRITIPPTFIGYTHSKYGDVMIADIASVYGYSWNDYPSYYDPKTGRFVLNVVYYVDAGRFGYGEEYLQMDGFDSSNDLMVKAERATGTPKVMRMDLKVDTDKGCLNKIKGSTPLPRKLGTAMNVKRQVTPSGKFKMVPLDDIIKE